MSLDNSSRTRRWKRYPKYKDSGIEWLGEVPEEWENKKIKHLARRSKEINGPTPFGEMLAVSGLWGIIVKQYENEDKKRLNEDLTQYRVVHHGQLVVNTMWLNYAGVGVSDLDGHVSPAYDVFNIFGVIEKKYLHHLLRSSRYVSGYCSKLYGIRPNSLQVSTYDWDNLSILFPQIIEQILIAAFLDRETTQIDTLIAMKERQIVLLQEKQGVFINHIITKGLDPNIKLKDSGVEWIGKIPEHWKILKNKWIYHEIDERSTTGEEELLSVSHITGVTPRSEKDVTMFLPLSFEGYKLCKTGDLAINTMWAFMGALGFSPCDGIVSPSYNIYRLKKKFVLKYFDYLYRTPPFIGEIFCHSKGVWTSRLRLYPKEFLSMMSIIPPVDEQKKIVEHIDSVIQKEKVQIEKIQQSINLLKEYRTALISAAVTGKIDVRQEISA